MLFITKGGVAKRTTEAMRPMFEVFNRIGTLPATVWTDPQTLGFLSGAAYAFAQIFGRGKYNQSNAGEVVIIVFDKLNGSGLDTIKRIATMMQTRNALFLESMNAGTLSMMISHAGLQPYLGQPLVSEAIKSHTANPLPLSESLGREAAVSSWLMDRYLHGPILKMMEAVR